MVAVRVVPCLDIRQGRVVKGIRFQNLRDAGDPVAHAAFYQEQGADEIVLLDVSATPEGRSHAVETVRQVRSVLTIPLTVGGGVRTTEDASRLLESGADKVAVNTAAVARPALITELAERFGSQCTVISVDAARAGRNGWQVVVGSGRIRTGTDVVAWCTEATALGAGEILLTSWDRDGTREGYDTDLVAAVARAVAVPVIASGGAATANHLVTAVEAGASAVLVASMLHDGDTRVGVLKSELTAAGVEVRP
ncbi:MAG: imidazole glycerol phosphate synthase subunit HisF [Acidimicrobiia bacterium]|nr:MAG: imidazole glycerol phosphate synthase subunit HisF [Acidimicrobiia bacterium]